MLNYWYHENRNKNKDNSFIPGLGIKSWPLKFWQDHKETWKYTNENGWC